LPDNHRHRFGYGRDPRSFLFSAKVAYAAAAIVAVCSVIMITVTIVQIYREGKQIRLDEAKVAARWIADRLVLLNEGNQTDIIRPIAASIRAKVWIFNKDGRLKAQSDPEKFPGDKIADVFKGKFREISLAGESYNVASCVMGSNSDVVVVATEIGSSFVRPVNLLRLIVAALIFILSAGIFGYAAGGDYDEEIRCATAEIERLVDRFDAIEIGSPQLAIEGEMTDVIDAVRDLQMRCRTEMTLFLDAQDEVEAFADRRSDHLSSVSADLYASLNLVVSLSDRLITGKDGELLKSQQEDLEIINHAGERLRAMVEEIFDLSSLMSERLIFDDEPLDMVEIADEVVKISRGQLGDKKLSLDLKCKEGEACFVRGNRRRLWQIITNLVSNALKFTDEGSIIVAVSKRGDGKIEVSVADTGPGIDAINHDAIFDTFRQITGRKKAKKGTGLGLAICKRLVFLHGGEIKVGSAVGQGAEFTVTLPGINS